MALSPRGHIQQCLTHKPLLVFCGVVVVVLLDWLGQKKKKKKTFISLSVGIGRKIAHHFKDGKYNSDKKEESLNFR